MRQIVHLKLCADFPPEVQEAAVLQDEGDRCSALIRVKSPDRMLELVVPFTPCSDFDPAEAISESGWPSERLAEPAYWRLIDALRKLALEMRSRRTE